MMTGVLLVPVGNGKSPLKSSLECLLCVKFDPVSTRVASIASDRE